MVSLHGVRSQNITSHKSKKVSQIKRKMAEQVITSETITRAVTEATRITIQTWQRLGHKDQKVNEDPN